MGLRNREICGYQDSKMTEKCPEKATNEFFIAILCEKHYRVMLEKMFIGRKTRKKLEAYG